MADGRGGEAAECGGAADDQSGLDESSRGRRRLRTVVRALRVACDRLLLAEEVAGAESSRARFVVETAGATDGAAGFALLAGRGSLVRPAGGPGATFTAVYSPKTSCGWPSDSYGVVARRQVSPERRLDEARWSRLASPALRRPSIARSFRVRKAFHPTNFRPGFRNFAAAMKQPLHCSPAGSTLVEQPSTVAASLFVAAACSSWFSLSLLLPDSVTMMGSAQRPLLIPNLDGLTPLPLRKRPSYLLRIAVLLSVLVVIVITLTRDEPKQAASLSLQRLKSLPSRPWASAATTNLAVQSCEVCHLDPTNPLCEYGEHNIRLSRAFEGSGYRLQRFMRKVLAGEEVQIGVLGASVTQGHSVPFGNPIWHEVWFKDFQERYPNSKMHVGAVGATDSEVSGRWVHLHRHQRVDSRGRTVLLVLLPGSVARRRHRPLPGRARRQQRPVSRTQAARAQLVADPEHFSAPIVVSRR